MARLVPTMASGYARPKWAFNQVQKISNVVSLRTLPSIPRLDYGLLPILRPRSPRFHCLYGANNLGPSSSLSSILWTSKCPNFNITWYGSPFHRRHFFTRRAVTQAERQAMLPESREDPRQQAAFYRELLRANMPHRVIDCYERQPQLDNIAAMSTSEGSSRHPHQTVHRIQNDPECFQYYLQALAQANRLRAFTDRYTVLPRTLGYDASSSAASAASFVGFDKLPGSSFPSPVPPELQYGLPSETAQPFSAPTARTDSQSSFWDRIVTAQQPTGEPLRVVVTEVWSWSRFIRKVLLVFLYVFLFFTGVSLILDQQGVIKSGFGADQAETLPEDQIIRFADVEGVDEAKAELEEIVAFLKEPHRFKNVGGKLPKGILLYGPPGTGKTHLARAVAGEAGVPFFQMSGSEFDELYVGVGARRVRELFTLAKKKAPCIVFIDELDAVGSKRNPKDQSYMRQTLNQLLVELDGFTASENVIFIAATNTPEALDKALVRPGRFDRQVPVPLPDVKGRSRILEVHMKGIHYGKDVNVGIIARGTPGFSGADLANLLNMAAIRASKHDQSFVRMHDLEWAKDKIIMGSERKSAVISEANRKLTAYHEGGHALVAFCTQGAIPLHKVTVIPRGQALGVTVQLPEADQTNHTRRELLAMLDVCMGGRVAEELVLGADEVTTGASSDLEKASAIAREMVMQFGMSDKVGVVSYRDADFDKLSPQTRALVESEVKILLEEAYGRAKTLLLKRRKELDRLADALMEHETLNYSEVEAAIDGRPIPKLAL